MQSLAVHVGGRTKALVAMVICLHAYSKQTIADSFYNVNIYSFRSNAPYAPSRHFCLPDKLDGCHQGLPWYWLLSRR